MQLTWLGHSAFHLDIAGRSVLIDPFWSGNPKHPAGFEDTLERADFIVLTHGHSDHLGDSARLAKKYGATVVAMFEIVAYLGGHGVEPSAPPGHDGHPRSLASQRESHRPPDPAAPPRDQGGLAPEPPRHGPGPRLLISSTNSPRVMGQSRKAPSMAEVTAFEFCFSTPRISMQRWTASMTTPTPRGLSASWRAWAMSPPNRSGRSGSR